MDADDRRHNDSLDLFETDPGPLVVPTLVVTEVVYLVGTRLGYEAEVRLLGDFAAGTFVAEPVQPADWMRIAELVATYSDLELGTVDASVVTVCERLGVTEVATLDRRDFEVVRPRHVPRLTLLP